MKAEPEDEEVSEEPTTIPASQGNIFAHFAFDASRGSLRSRTPEAISPISSKLSDQRKRKADVDEQGPVNSKTKRTMVDKTPEIPGVNPRSSSSKVKLYDHLRPLHDNLDTGLDIIFCGINPGQQSAEIGHHYGNPNNHFWSCLHESGLTTRKLDPREDATLPRDFSIGLTNLVARPTAQQNELSKAEQVAGVSILLTKVARHRPRVLCFVGLGIADVVRSNISPLAAPEQEQEPPVSKPKSKSKRTSAPKTVIGLQPYKMVHRHGSPTDAGFRETLFFAVSSTSGRVVRYQKADKVKQFQDFRQLVMRLKEGTLDTSSIVEIAAPAQLNLGADDTEGTGEEAI